MLEKQGYSRSVSPPFRLYTPMRFLSKLRRHPLTPFIARAVGNFVFFLGIVLIIYIIANG